jgi:pyruvate dehydrogenase E2 component (dihydrolipoamide acetyltransferase)
MAALPGIQPITMPKWGLAMTEGMVAEWHVKEGDAIESGQEICDIETSKITNAYESPVGGPLRRRVVGEGETVPVGALLAVVAPPEVPDAEVDAFVRDFQESFAAKAAEAAEAGPEPETIELGGRRFRYLKTGGGEGAPPVVLVHGFGGDLNNWLFNQADLSEGRVVYAVDLPGHGGSAKDVGEGTVAAMADALVAFLDGLGTGPAHLVGHSLGGAVGLELALRDPARVLSLTLICPAGLGPEINAEYIEGFIGASRRKQLKPVLEMLVADPELISRDMVEDVLRYKRLDGAEAALRAVAGAAFKGGRQAARFDDRLGELRVPVQVIWGREDRIVPAAHAANLPSSVPVHVLDGAGHMVHMEKAAEVNRLIADLIRRG